MRLFLFLFLISVNLHLAFSQDFDWVKGIGGAGSDEGRSIISDASGNIYSVGTFQLTSDFDPGPGTQNFTSLGGTDIYISKLDALGNMIWTKQLGTTTDDFAWSIGLDQSDNIYITGYFEGILDIDPNAGVVNLISAGIADGFVLKLDSNGDFIWAHNIGGTFYDAGIDLFIDSFDNLILTGRFLGTVDFDPGPSIYNISSWGISDVFICKFDAFGNFIWGKSIGGIGGSIVPTSIENDNNENIYLTGFFGGTVDFDPGVGYVTLTSSATDIFILKLNNLGNYVWAKKMGGPNEDKSLAMAIDSDDNILITGNFYSIADFDASASTYNLTSVGSSDIFVCKYMSDGEFTWAKSFGSTDFDEGSGITIDQNGNVYMTGLFRNTIDFDPGAGSYSLSSNGSGDIFISVLDFDGEFVWAGRMGGFFNDSGYGIVVDDFGSIITTGYYQGNTVDFDPGSAVFNLTTISAYRNVFIQKLQCITTYNTLMLTACDSYTVPSGDETYFASGTYMDTILNTSGCMEILTIIVEIFNSSASNISLTKCTFYEVPSGDEIYTTSGTFMDTIPNSVGCDSIITITLNIIPPSLDTLIIVDCNNSYTVPSGDETYSYSGLYHDTIPNLTGCDSIISIFFYSKSYALLNVNTCDSYTVPSGDEIYNMSGIYFDTIPNFIGCDSIISIDLTIYQSPNVIITADSVIFCAPANIIFYNNSSTPVGSSCLWSFEGGGSSNNCGAVYNSFITAGNYDVTLQITSPEGCIGNTTYIDYIEILPPPVLAQISDTAVCDDVFYSSPLFDAGIPGSLFYWSAEVVSSGIIIASGNTNQAAFNIDLNNISSDIITVTCVADSPQGCLDTISFEIFVLPNPNALFEANILLGCAPFTINFTDLTNPIGTACYWQFGDGTTSGICGDQPHTYINAGIYSVSLSIENSYGCIDSSIFTDYIQVSLPQSFDLGADTVLCATSLTLDAGSGHSGYGWFDTSTGQFTSVTSDGDYWAYVYDAGCFVYDTIHVDFLQTEAAIFINSCLYYTVPSGDETYFVSGIYQDTIVNSSGCDSIITINLTINNIDNSVIQNNITLSSNEVGATYQWLDCNNSFSEILGETNQDFTATSNGLYAVEVTNNGCVDTSICFLINQVGLSQLEYKTLSIYPNPSKGIFTIERNNQENQLLNYSIYNVLGDEILNGTLDVGQSQVEIKLEAKGVYFLQILSTDELETIQLIVQ